MKKRITEIGLFESLIEFEFSGTYVDLHNEYDCVKILFFENSLTFHFKKIDSEFKLKLIFTQIEFCKLNMCFEKTDDFPTIDLLYRGRYEKENKLFDIIGDKGYIYVEFCEDWAFEFFSYELLIEIVQ